MANATGNTEKSVRIGFLFNHDQRHQIAHSAPIAFELSRQYAQIEVTILASCPKQLDYVQQLARMVPDARCRYQSLALRGVLAWLAPIMDALMPYRRVAMLLSNRRIFASLDVLVVPEKTSLMLRSLLGLTKLKMIYTSHGAGDRAIGFDNKSDKFDLAFMAGQKICDRLTRAGLAHEGHYAIIGYPKFDLYAGKPRSQLFNNDRPTVLYNPHFSPNLSSWYRNGLDILEYFYQSKKYNLVFAPHVMLFRKSVHIDIHGFSFERPGVIPDRYRNCPHMLIDPGSEQSIDMTYTLAADLYLGDVSSQVYEFLYEPRPCLFFDAYRTNWRDNENYSHWNAGPVVDDVALLDKALSQAFITHASYQDQQRQMFAYTFDLTGQPSSQRAAAAIAAFVSEQPQTTLVAAQ